MNSNTKGSDIAQALRHIIQAVSFVLAPGLFISVFSAIGTIVRAVTSFSLSWEAVGSSLLLLFLVMVTTALTGRFFCSYLCSFGTMQEYLWMAADKLGLHKRIDAIKISTTFRYLKYIKYAVLAFIAIAFWTLGARLGSSMDPWSVFGMYTSLAGWKSLAPMLTLGGAALLIIVISSLFVERPFCRALCPLGAMFSLVSRGKLIKIKRNNPMCSECGMCSRSCAMGIDMSREEVISSGECISCNKCIGACPVGNLSGNSKKVLAAGLVTTMLMAAGCSAVTALTTSEPEVSVNNEPEIAYEEENNTWDEEPATEDAQDAAEDVMNGTYQDGTYTGTGQGFRGEIQVEVTVSGGKITNVELLSSYDDQEFFNRAWSGIVSALTGSDSTEVDTVSGATFSSNGIIEAVKNALGEQYDNPNASMEGGHGHHGPHGY